MKRGISNGIYSKEFREQAVKQCAQESFWGLLKNELVHHRQFKTRAEAIQAITEYIEIFYKWKRVRLVHV
jgi:transposase InsO family protein